MAEIKDIESAKAAAQNVVESQRRQTEERKIEFEKIMN